MTDKKPSTAEIMAMLRKKSADGAAAPSPAPAEAAAPVAPSEAAPSGAAPQPTPAASPPAVEKPKSTTDIMAAIRAKGATPAAPAAAAAPPASAAPAASAAKPKGTSDIMASIRAKGAAPAAAAAPVAAAPAAEASKAAVPAAAGKSAADMIKAMRASAAKPEAAAGESAPAAVAAAKPKFPAKPSAPAAGKKGEELPRRSFVGALFEALCTPYYFAWTMLSAIGAIGGLGMARFMMPNTVLELPSKFKVGAPGDFPLGTVSEKYKASRGVWIVHTDSYDGQNVIYALSSVCTHLGCTPSWLDAEQKYKCPCHGSGFYLNGINFEGPAPRPLERVGLSVGPDGLLEVDKSLKFQEELGQWSDQKSFVKVG